jgi:hypothetical protein
MTGLHELSTLFFKLFHSRLDVVTEERDFMVGGV